MNALCAYCPWNYLCSDNECVDDLKREKEALVKERAVLRERLIENGLEAGASIWMHGQRIDVKT